MGSVHQLHPTAPTVTGAIDAALEHLSSTPGPGGRPRSPRTLRAYRTALELVLDVERPLAELDVPAGATRLRTRFTERWGQAAPATVNARRAALRTALGYWRDRGWLTTDPLNGIDPRPVPVERPAVIARTAVARLLANRRHPLRERTLWSLLYDSAARIEEVLALDVADVDLRNRRARVRRKGGAADTIAWNTGTARLLSTYLGHRTTGPLFLTERAAWGADRGRREHHDIDPNTGRGRLGYRQAHTLLHDATGWTPHQFRHAALTHAGEDGMPLPLLMTKSGHISLRSVQRYVRPSIEAVQRWQEEHR